MQIKEMALLAVLVLFGMGFVDSWAQKEKEPVPTIPPMATMPIPQTRIPEMGKLLEMQRKPKEYKLSENQQLRLQVQAMNFQLAAEHYQQAVDAYNKEIKGIEKENGWPETLAYDMATRTFADPLPPMPDPAKMPEIPKIPRPIDKAPVVQ